MQIEPEYHIGQFVYLHTDPEQQKRIVTSITVDNDGLSYTIALGPLQSVHFAFELSETKDLFI